MCGCERQPAYSASLKPPRGEPLGLQEGVTWIGRGTFEASLRAQLLCSRRQACLTLTETGLSIECHGINSLLFVDCHAKNVHGSEATPATKLFQLRKGDAVNLADGDRFYFAAMECLLTVVIGQNHIAEISGFVEPRPLQQASEACVTVNEEIFVENEQQVAEVSQVLLDPAQACGTSDSQSKNAHSLYANNWKTTVALRSRDLAGTQEILAAPKLSVIPTVDFPVSRKYLYESVGNDLEDSDSLGLDAYDCLPRVKVSRLHVKKSLLSISPRREEVSSPAAAVDDDNHLNESYQCPEENLVEQALPNSAVDEVVEVGECVQSAQDAANGEACSTCSIPEVHQSTETRLCSKDVAHEPGVHGDLLKEGSPCREHLEQEVTNLIVPSETVSCTPAGDELVLSEPERSLAVQNVREYQAKCPNVDKSASGVLPGSPIPIVIDAITIGEEVEEHPEVSGRANERDEDPELSTAVEDFSWPSGPVEGMESVIVSVSGYEGIDRQKLVNLINKTGAAYTGQLSKANTHLVCWEFHGKKFDRAMKLHKPVINHQWFEDILRAGKRLPESPYKFRSGDEVGPLKWKETLQPLVLERAAPADRVTNQHRIDPEGQPGKFAICASSDREDWAGISRQAALPIADSGRSGGRKRSRKLVKLSFGQGNLARENPVVPPTGCRGSYQRRTGETAIASEVGSHKTRRKSDSSTRRDEGEVHGLYAKRRKAASSVLDRCIDDHGRGAVSNLRERAVSNPTSQSAGGTVGELTVVNLSDDVDVGRENDVQIPHLLHAPATEGIDTDINRGKNPECSQISQRDREVACAICLVETKSPSEGLLECGHKFCYTCIFKWSLQAVKGPSCPLCKASCDFITRQELDSSGKLDETVIIVGEREVGSSSGIQRTIVVDSVCIQCGNSDAESLLLRCGYCGNRVIHTFCLDPPAPPPWYCPACTQSHHRDSMRLAWNQFLPGSTPVNVDPEASLLASSARRRNAQPHAHRRPPPVSAYRPTLHAELTQSMGPARRTNIVGQHSLLAWLNNETSNANT